MQSGSLYRKYRPQTFEELVGQEAIARTLRNAVALDRVAHAYLFCGPRGTGKTSTARLLAKAVNCRDADPWRRPCNQCGACRSIATGTAVDIIEIDAASNRGVDDIRDLREKVKYAPVELRTKFYIIDEAHQLTRDAFNAFLKTLEEPPPHVVFVLATTEPDKLPETVASRCQRFDFRRLPVDRMVERLRFVCLREGIDAPDDVLALIARRAAGSLRDALGLLERLAVFASDGENELVITLELARQVLGGSRDDRLLDLVTAIADRDAGRALRLVAEAADAGDDLHQLGRELVRFTRTLLYVRAGGSDPAPAARGISAGSALLARGTRARSPSADRSRRAPPAIRHRSAAPPGTRPRGVDPVARWIAARAHSCTFWCHDGTGDDRNTAARCPSGSTPGSPRQQHRPSRPFRRRPVQRSMGTMRSSISCSRAGLRSGATSGLSTAGRLHSWLMLNHA
jgi:DNA polymerase III subunit gamma/tau